MKRAHIALLLMAAPAGYMLGTAALLFSQWVPQETTWVLIRSSGFAAYVLLTITTAWGFAWKTVARSWLPALAHSAWHRYLAVWGSIILVAHVLLLLFDQKVGFSVLEVLVPGLSSYRAQAVALGILASYLLGLVSFGFYVKDLVKSNWWATLHRLVPLAWVMATLHGIWAGTDSNLLWAQVIYWGSTALVSFFGLLRLLGYQEDVQKVQASK